MKLHQIIRNTEKNNKKLLIVDSFSIFDISHKTSDKCASKIAGIMSTSNVVGVSKNQVIRRGQIAS